MTRRAPAASQHFGVWTHTQGRKVAAYARKNDHFGGYVVYDAQTGRRVSGDKTFSSVAALCEALPFEANEAGVVTPKVAPPPKKKP